MSRSTSWRVTRGYDAIEGGGGFWSGMGWLGLGEQADKKEDRKRRGSNSRVSSVVEICSGQRPGSLETDKGAPLGNGREPGQREGRAGQSGHWASRARRREKKTQGRRRLGKLVRAGPGRKRTGARGPKPKGFHDPSGPKRNGTGSWWVRRAVNYKLPHGRPRSHTLPCRDEPRCPKDKSMYAIYYDGRGCDFNVQGSKYAAV